MDYKDTLNLPRTDFAMKADLVTRALKTPEDDGALSMVRAEVETLCRKFPLYPE